MPKRTLHVEVESYHGIVPPFHAIEDRGWRIVWVARQLHLPLFCSRDHAVQEVLHARKDFVTSDVASLAQPGIVVLSKVERALQGTTPARCIRGALVGQDSERVVEPTQPCPACDLDPPIEFLNVCIALWILSEDDGAARKDVDHLQIHPAICSGLARLKQALESAMPQTMVVTNSLMYTVGEAIQLYTARADADGHVCLT